MANGLLDSLEYCPLCGGLLEDRADHPICGSCGAAVDRSSIVVRGRRPEDWSPWLLVLVWFLPMTAALAIGALDVALAATILLVVHAGFLMTRRAIQKGPPRETLVITSEGIGRLHGIRSLEVLPFHLFEEARLRTWPGDHHDAAAPSRWRLTVVNAYKPSISVFLHSRGTDAPIFCSAFDIVIETDESSARQLQSLLQERINSARSSYRAMRIRELDQEAITRRRFRRRSTCPRCAAAIAGEEHADQCWRCRSFVCFSPDEPRFVLDARAVTWRPGLGLISIAVALVSIWPFLHGDWLAALPWLILPSMYVVWSVWKGLRDHTEPARQWLVTRDGLELWVAERCEQRLSWHDLPTVRYVQLERGSWRLGMWGERGLHITFSPMLFTWFASPACHPTFDAVLADVDLAGRMICEEVARRQADARGEDASHARIILSHEINRTVEAGGQP